MVRAAVTRSVKQAEDDPKAPTCEGVWQLSRFLVAHRTPRIQEIQSFVRLELLRKNHVLENAEVF